MKNLTFLLLALVSAVVTSQVGINTTSPAGMLDISSTDEGILIPRVALVQTTQELPVTNPKGGGIENSTMVYNTATVNDVFPGYYYWQNGRWIRLANDPRFLTFTTITLPNPTGLNEDQDFLLPTTNYNVDVFRILHDGADLGGISDGIHGRVIYMYNGDASKDMKLLSLINSTSAATNKFSLENDVILKPGNAIILFYDALYLNRWIVARSDN